MWNCWKVELLTPSFNLSRRFSLVLYCPVTYRVALEALGEHHLPQQDPSDIRGLLSYLNGSILLPTIDLGASVGWGQERKGAAGKLCLLVSGTAARETCPTAG